MPGYARRLAPIPPKQFGPVAVSIEPPRVHMMIGHADFLHKTPPTSAKSAGINLAIEETEPVSGSPDDFQLPKDTHEFSMQSLKTRYAGGCWAPREAQPRSNGSARWSSRAIRPFRIQDHRASRARTKIHRSQAAAGGSSPPSQSLTHLQQQVNHETPERK